MFAVPRSEIRRIHASSGTTGQPTLSAYTAKDIDDWAKLMARSIRAWAKGSAAFSSASIAATIRSRSSPVLTLSRSAAAP